jgi:hypothetical protein
VSVSLAVVRALSTGWSEDLPHIVNLRSTAHETGELHRKIRCGNGFGCAKSRELVAQVRDGITAPSVRDGEHRAAHDCPDRSATRRPSETAREPACPSPHAAWLDPPCSRAPSSTAAVLSRRASSWSPTLSRARYVAATSQTTASPRPNGSGCGTTLWRSIRTIRSTPSRESTVFVTRQGHICLLHLDDEEAVHARGSRSRQP